MEPTPAGTVAQLFRYPVKSMQGLPVESVTIDADRIRGDRRWGLIDEETGALMSAKRYRQLLLAACDGTRITTPEGSVALDDPAVSRVLSDWLDRPVHLHDVIAEPLDTHYQMTLDPPDDDAELFDIPTPHGSFTDLAAVHLITRQTLEGLATQRPDLDWDVRRFRPNLVIDADVEPFGEDSWCGHDLRVGGAVLHARQPTVRCAMPLRAQPGLDRQTAMYRAMESIHANHVGIYLDVVQPGPVAAGDPVTIC